MFCIRVISAKSTKTVTQIAPQQIVVIKQPDDVNSSTDKKHTILLKQLQQHPRNQQQRVSLSSLQKCQSRNSTGDQKSPIAASASITEIRKNVTAISEAKDGGPVLTAKQDALQQLLAKHQNELKLQQDAKKDTLAVTSQQSKTLPKQMIVVKQNQGQLTTETQYTTGGGGGGDDDRNNAAPKQVSSPLVILNKQQYQQQLQNSKHQIIQLSGQQLTTHQIQQMLMKQQQQQLLKRVATQQQNVNLQHQQQQIVMLKPEIQASSRQQQIVMVKHQPTQSQQQLVMIKQATASSASQSTATKSQQKQPQTQIIQIASNAGVVGPVSSDLSKVSNGRYSSAFVQNERSESLEFAGDSNE